MKKKEIMSLYEKAQNGLANNDEIINLIINYKDINQFIEHVKINNNQLEYLVKHRKRIDWSLISRVCDISEEFIIKYSKCLDLDTIRLKQNCSSEYNNK